MKAFERILIKAAIIQLIFLLLSQCFLHSFPAYSRLKPITKYEGVYKHKFIKTTETMSNH